MLSLMGKSSCVAAIGAMHFSVRSFGCALFYIIRRHKTNIKKALAVLTVLSVCVIATGCGSSSSSSKKVSNLDSISEKDIEKAAEEIENGNINIDDIDTNSDSVEPETEVQITYEPTEEILNADFSSGLVQIGNDIFRNGGYLTVNQFIEEYSDRYDLSEINPNGLIDSKKTDTFKIYSLLDPSLKASVTYMGAVVPDDSDNDVTKIGDAYVLQTDLISADCDNCWYPTGVRCNAEGYNYDNVNDLWESTNLPQISIDDFDFKYDYWIDHDEMVKRGDEVNLLGFYPLYIHKFFIREETGEAYSFKVTPACWGRYSWGDLEKFTPAT